MGEQTGISWTQKTWNPWQGCRKKSTGCLNCYMHRDKKRYGQDPADVHRSSVATFNSPLKWKDPSLVFACSWSDFFIEEADAWRPEAWAIIRRTPHLTYQIPTKRPERIAASLPVDWGTGYPNVWLGVSAENQAAWNLRVPILQNIPASVRWVSVEPMVGEIRPLRADFHGLSWVVVGGESGGPEARPMNLAWMRTLKAACWAAGVRVFIKQLGAHPVLDSGILAARPTDRARSIPDGWPEDLRVREWPAEFPKASATG
jgi:protein gp37